MDLVVGFIIGTVWDRNRDNLDAKKLGKQLMLDVLLLAFLIQARLVSDKEAK